MFMSNASGVTSNPQLPLSGNFAYFNSLNQTTQPQQPGPWVITAQEHQQNEGQFVVLRPTDGLVGGEQARPFFLKSGLPASILAQIWQLADINKDGKLDRLEFSIAMKLVRNCLSGLPLPPSLPESMLQISGRMGIGPGGGPRPMMPMPPTSSSFLSNGGGLPPSASTLPSRPLSTYGSMNALSSISSDSYRPPTYGSSYSAAQTPSSQSPPFLMGIKELGDWSLPQPMKLRFSQQFNQLDKGRVGLLTGQQARGVLGESQLPTNVLAQIWNMSDVNRDGCLSIEEFCTAMFLVAMVKAGYALPSKLPNELHSFCKRSKTVSPSPMTSNDNDPSAPPPQKPGHGHFRTFEDKRKDNLDKGQAELDRRRQILQEEEDRRRAEIERREREEAERKERERQELERRREAEMEAQRRREMERERERTAEEERLKAEREEVRKRMEQERIRELEKIRIRDLENQLQTEAEKSTQIRQRQRTMAFQLQALEERSEQLNGEITEARDGILGITQEIEGMRGQRDQKLAKINELERNAKELSVQSERFSHENLQLQSEFQRQLTRVNEIDALRQEMGELEEEIRQGESEMETIGGRTRNQEKLVDEKRPDWEGSCEMSKGIQQAFSELLEQYDKVRSEAGAPKAAQQYEMPPDVNFGTDQRSIAQSATSSVPNNEFKPDFSAAFGETERRKSVEQSGTANTENGIASRDEQQRRDSLKQPPVTNEHQQHGQVMGQVKTVKYKALYEFNARSVDELSIQPGDLILVFEGHKSEPGWLAGQIRDKIGWFPAAFAEPMSANRAPEGVKKGNSLTSSPSSEPLASIKEEGEPPSTTQQSIDKNLANAETTFKADFVSAFSKSISLNDTTTSGPTAMGQAEGTFSTQQSGSMSASASIGGVLYDVPPSGAPQMTAVASEVTSAIQSTSVPMYEVPPGDVVGPPSEFVDVLAVGVALYQWKARNEQEMSFARGDKIEVLEQGEMRWRGRLQKDKKVEGWFPKSYVKLDNNVKEQEKQQPRETETKGTMDQTTKAQIENDGGTEGEWYTALYQFDAVEATDLSLKPGDRIWVIDQRDQWWRGTCEGRTGIFPANYVQKVKENGVTEQPQTTTPSAEKQMIGKAIAVFEATASNQISLRPGDVVKIHQTTPGGWWEGELDRDGLKQTGWFPGNYIQLLQSAEDQPQSVLAVAAFDYAAQHDDELTFKAGDVIEVDDQSDAHWWKGRKQGQAKGTPLLFPANFVQMNK